MSIYPFRAVPSSCFNSEYQENVKSVYPEGLRNQRANSKIQIHTFLEGKKKITQLIFNHPDLSPFFD